MNHTGDIQKISVICRSKSDFVICRLNVVTTPPPGTFYSFDQMFSPCIFAKFQLDSENKNPLNPDAFERSLELNIFSDKVIHLSPTALCIW